MNVYLTVRGGGEGKLDTCPDTCRGSHPLLLYVVQRKATAFGHFPVVSLNGTSEVIDPSLPTEVERLPRDARILSPKATSQAWHDDNESHVFAGPNVAAQLRAAIKRVNEAGTRG